MGQVLLAPYRLPTRLAKSVWKTFRRERQKRATTEYQKWFEQHRANAQDLERMRDKARTFASQPLISIITPVFDTPVSRLEEAVQSVLAQAYENWELLLIDDGSTDSDLLRILPHSRGATGESSWRTWENTEVSLLRRIVDSGLLAESGSLFSTTMMFSSRMRFFKL